MNALIFIIRLCLITSIMCFTKPGIKFKVITIIDIIALCLVCFADGSRSIRQSKNLKKCLCQQTKQPKKEVLK